MSKRRIDNITYTERTELEPGIANHVVINDVNGNLSSEATLSTSRGGFGTNVSSITGIPKFTTGVLTSVGTITNSDVDINANISDSKLATISTTGKVSNSATTASSSNVASSIVARDSGGQIDVSFLRLLGTSNQLIFRRNDTGNSIAVSLASAPASTRIYTLPDTGRDSSFVLAHNASISFVTPGGTAAPLDYFETQLLNVNFVNNITQSLTVYAQRIGKQVTLMFPDAVSSTGRAAGVLSTNINAIPSRFVPAYYFLQGGISTLDNGSRDSGLIQIDGSGVIAVFKDKSANGFSGVGAQGFSSFSITYLVP